MNLKELLEQLTEDVEYTSTDGQYPHSHKYNIDREGNGQTTIMRGAGPEHIHAIVRYEVKPAGEDAHTHTLPQETQPDEEEGEE